MMLSLSTSIAMAQFGSLKELREKEGQGGNNSGSTSENPTLPGQYAQATQIGDAQLIEKCIANGFFLVRQEYQLEEKNNPGSRYNWGDEQYFDYRVSFMVRLTNGFITTNSIVSPWTEEGEEENKFTQYQNTHNPVFSKTLTLKLGQKGWKTEGNVFRPKEEGELNNGLKFVKDDDWKGDGFRRASGFGKKDVYIVWLLDTVRSDNSRTIAFRTERVEINLEQGNNHCEVTVPEKPFHVHALCGVVVEPVFEGIGRLELALVGVIDNEFDGIDPFNGWPVRISILGQNMGEAIDPSSDKSLTPTEGSNSEDKNNNKKSSN